MKFHAAALIMGSLACLPAHSTEEPVDPVLLEFLGSVDSEDKNWHEYLAHTDIEKVARHQGAAREASEPPVAAPPPPQESLKDSLKEPRKQPPADPLPSSPAPVNQK